jgi:hypothetical protein
MGSKGERAAMRLPKGTKVEVWVEEASAWRAGVVIWGNGHAYDIKWFDGGSDSRRIKRKYVRPIPDPKVKLPKEVAPGDILELSDSNQWKWVEVVRVGNGQLDVKFLGSTNVLTADVSDLRPRLMYREEGWALIPKVTSPSSSPHARPLRFRCVCRTNGLALFLLRCRTAEVPYRRALSPVKTSRAKPLAKAAATSPRMPSIWARRRRASGWTPTSSGMSRDFRVTPTGSLPGEKNLQLNTMTTLK